MLNEWSCGTSEFSKAQARLASITTPWRDYQSPLRTKETLLLTGLWVSEPSSSQKCFLCPQHPGLGENQIWPPSLSGHSPHGSSTLSWTWLMYPFYLLHIPCPCIRARGNPILRLLWQNSNKIQPACMYKYMYLCLTPMLPLYPSNSHVETPVFHLVMFRGNALNGSWVHECEDPVVWLAPWKSCETWSSYRLLTIAKWGRAPNAILGASSLDKHSMLSGSSLNAAKPKRSNQLAQWFWTHQLPVPQEINVCCYSYRTYSALQLHHRSTKLKDYSLLFIFHPLLKGHCGKHRRAQQFTATIFTKAGSLVYFLILWQNIWTEHNFRKKGFL